MQPHCPPCLAHTDIREAAKLLKNSSAIAQAPLPASLLHTAGGGFPAVHVAPAAHYCITVLCVHLLSLSGERCACHDAYLAHVSEQHDHCMPMFKIRAKILQFSCSS